MPSIRPLRPSGADGLRVVGRARSAAPTREATPFSVDRITPRISIAVSRALRQLVAPLPNSARTTDLADGSWLTELGPPLDIRHAELENAIADQAQELMRAAAERRNVSPARLAATFDIVSPHARPSRNSDASRSHLRTSLPGLDAGDRLTLDFHLARVAESGWEVVLFDKASAATGIGFPYRETPICAVALQLDGRMASFVRHDPHRMLQISGPAPSSAHECDRRHLSNPARWTVATLAIAATTLALLLIAKTR